MTIHRLKLKDFSYHHLDELKEQYADKDIEIEIIVPTQNQARENSFWHIIDQLDWSKKGADEAVLKPAIQALSELPESDMIQFYDWLSEKLYLLDGENYANNSVKKEEYISVDLFLYARCCVVANGREFYENVLNNPTDFPKDLFFEKLLTMPEFAWQQKTGKPLDHIPKFIYETGFNPDGWSKKAITL